MLVLVALFVPLSLLARHTLACLASAIPPALLSPLSHPHPNQHTTQTQKQTLPGAASAASYPNFAAALGANAGQFSTISTFLNKANMAAAFTNPNLINTVFVPTNAAFQAAAKSTGVNINSFPAATIKQVIYYHVVKGAYTTNMMTNGQRLPTLLNGQSLTVAKSGANVVIKGVGSSASVIPALANIVCGKGIAQGVNNVLLPIALGK